MAQLSHLPGATVGVQVPLLTLSMFLSACGGGGGGGDSGGAATAEISTAQGTALLSWTPPTTNADGTALADLAGYNIYYGDSESVYTNKIPVTNPGLATYVVENLPDATWFFVVTAYDTSGNESDFSNVASKVIISP